MPAGYLPLNLLFALALLLILSGLGLRFTRPLLPDRGLMTVLVATGVGLYVFSGCIFILTAAGLLKWKIVAALLGSFSYLGFQEWRGLCRRWTFENEKKDLSQN